MPLYSNDGLILITLLHDLPNLIHRKQHNEKWRYCVKIREKKIRLGKFRATVNRMKRGSISYRKRKERVFFPYLDKIYSRFVCSSKFSKSEKGLAGTFFFAFNTLFSISPKLGKSGAALKYKAYLAMRIKSLYF